MMDINNYLLIILFLSAVLGSAINAVAGGGSFFTFPALIFSGIPILNANATSTVALWPGSLASAFSYKNQLDVSRKVMTGFCIISILGSVLGTSLLLITPPDLLKRLIPYLLLGATMILLFKKQIAKSKLSSKISLNFYLVLFIQFLISVYGGYFGGGIGILMLATFNLVGFSNLLQMNALKTLLATLINGAAVILFTCTNQVVWNVALVMVAGGIAGGLLGAYIGKSVSQVALNRFVIVTGFLLSIYFFIKS